MPWVLLLLLPLGGPALVLVTWGWHHCSWLPEQVRKLLVLLLVLRLVLQAAALVGVPRQIAAAQVTRQCHHHPYWQLLPLVAVRNYELLLQLWWLLAERLVQRCGRSVAAAAGAAAGALAERAAAAAAAAAPAAGLLRMLLHRRSAAACLFC